MLNRKRLENEGIDKFRLAKGNKAYNARNDDDVKSHAKKLNMEQR
jgi:hypothetical protein